MNDLDKIPDNMPQPKQLYLEQLEILGPILKSQNNISSSPIHQIPSREDTFETNNTKEASTSSGTTKKTSRKGKCTNYVGDCDEVMHCQSGTTLQKLKQNGPYNLFFTTILKSPETTKEKNGITFIDLLCPSLGKLKSSLQINFMIDIDWLLKQYKARDLHQKPLTILYGDDWPDMVEFMDRFCPNVKYKFVKMKDPFGIHHSKVGIYLYDDDSLRVVVSTANLYYEDWNHYNQGLWLSPRCPKLEEGSSSSGESITGFKADLLNYLKSYSLPILNDWIGYVKNCDFSNIKVSLVYSTPGKHYPKRNGCHLHKVGDLLSQHSILPAKTTPQSEGPLSWGINAQASSIGSLGKTPAEWLRGSILRSLASHKQGALPNSSNATLNVIYPSVENVANGYFGLESGGCLPYSKATNEKQKWLHNYLHQWKADKRHRSRAMPHIKSYCRVSPCLNKLSYFLLTSANLSKSAWGSNIQKDGGSYVRSCEVGVLFLPSFFDEDYFEIQNTITNKNKQLFPLMYDLPLTAYKKEDYPWCN
ncbi:probable tyrosyl-DNA phosphodiesterase isoform X2 [Cylas formicarius]|nr:probable tyrosyl-DNA phosphodiesterase isoform X2 [Cylas formicarius]